MLISLGFWILFHFHCISFVMIHLFIIFWFHMVTIKKDLVYFLGAYGRLEFSPLEFRLYFWIRLKESAEINYKFYCTTKGDTSWRRGTYPDKHLFNFSILTSLKCLSYKWHTLQGGYCKLKYWKCRWLILNKLRGQDITMF